MTHVVVLGAGAAGLSAALALIDAYRARGGQVGAGSGAGLRVTVLEARDQVGGRIGTEEHGGFHIETGAATLQESPLLTELARRVGIESDQVFSDERAARRYLFRADKLRRLPSRPPEVLLSDALSLPARLRLLLEPLVPALALGPRPLPPKDEAAPAADGAADGANDAAALTRIDDEADESVASFGRRRFGRRATEEILEPFLTGVYAGNIERLSMRSALPRLWNMERAHGSLFLAMRRARAASAANAPGRDAAAGPADAAAGPAAPRGAPRLCGFRHGSGQLVTALARAITEAGGEIRLGAPARSLSRRGDRYRIGLEDDELVCDRLILALPPPDAAPLCADLSLPLGDAYAQIQMAPIVAISLGWPREQVPHALDGFGFLVPRTERLRLLGVLFMTSVLPDYEQAPRGQVVLRAMYGGAHDTEIERQGDGALLELVRRDLKTTLGVLAEPRFIHIQRWPRAIEQYNLGHAARVAAIESRIAALPGLYATGAAFRGVAVPDVLREGAALGTRLGNELPIP